MESDPKNYEIAYLLAPSIPEEEILTRTGKFTKVIEESGGTLRHMEVPKKRELAYPIKKETKAYFGWTTFSMNPDSLAGFKKKLSGFEGLLRCLVTIEEAVQIATRIFPNYQTGRLTTEPKSVSSPGTEKPEEKLDLEALDKKLEEILGK